MRASSGVIFISSLVVPVRAYDVTDRFSISAAAAVTGQCQNLSGNSDASDSCRGALVFQPNLSFLPTPDNEFFVKLGLAAGNGLNDTSPFNPAPWATDLKDGVKDINGRGRNYLLTAWYRHGLILAPDNSLNITLGIIDATEFLDINAYANDEHTQFMNEVFVNSPQAFMPSYDWGGALQWDVGRWSFRGVLMHVGRKRDLKLVRNGKGTRTRASDDYEYLGVEIGYALETNFGEGNYRIVVSPTSADFENPSATDLERRLMVSLSFDQQLGINWGTFLRAHLQSQEAAVAYDYGIAGGIDVRGGAWGRTRDNIGLGIAYLHGGNQNIERTHVAEGYYRLVLGARAALTADIQYMHDEKKSGKDPKGFIFGVRADLAL